MGWIVALFLAALTGLVLLRFGRLPKGSSGFVAAAMLVALAGYAWQARPDLAGAPRQAVDEEKIPDTVFSRERTKMFGQFNAAGDWLTAADALEREGARRSAVSVLNEGVRQNPGSADLYVGLGNALTLYAGGMVTPAARLAFDRAAEIAPNHPGPPFFLGLALAQAGQLDEAGNVWRELLDRTPADAPYRADLEQKLAQLAAMRTQR